MKTFTATILAFILVACQEHPDEIVNSVIQTSESDGIVCVTETKGLECSREDGRRGVCIAPKACAIACNESAECPYAGPCRAPMCLDGACVFSPISNGIACEDEDGVGACHYGKCE